MKFCLLPIFHEIVLWVWSFALFIEFLRKTLTSDRLHLRKLLTAGFRYSGGLYFERAPYFVPSRSKKAGRFEKLLGIARSHSIVICGSVSLSCAFLNLNGTIFGF